MLSGIAQGSPTHEDAMHQIIYISTARPETTEKDIADVLRVSRRNNHRHGVTGLLVSDGTRFLQALEGDEAAVNAVYSRIKADARHRAPVILSTKSVSERQFGAWEMAFKGFGAMPADRTLAELVDQLVARVNDPNTRALFAGFARIRRDNAA
jgi:hypothetical protein